jgi:hypothetical protein
MSKVRPIKPSELARAKENSFPDEVFESFNELITENFSRGYANVPQEDVVVRMIEKGLDRGEIFKRGWLDVEDVYRASGWKVEYDKPGYNESYSAYFVFKKPSKSR